MDNIVRIDSSFNFDDISLDNPYPLQGGNFYTKISYTEKKLPLHLQLPKCNTKNGIVRSTTSKKSYCDLLFTSYESEMLSWLEGLENKCMDLIFAKKDIWFQSEMSLDDIENIFISPVRTYKSGKFVLIRAHIPIPKQLKRESCLIYDECEQMLNIEEVKDSMELIPLVCINGIKFSSKSFQLDITLPQIMVLSSTQSIKTECLIQTKRSNIEEKEINEKEINEKECLGKLEILDIESINPENEDIKEDKIEEKLDVNPYIETSEDNKSDVALEKVEDEPNDLKVVELNVADLADSITLKEPNSIYFEIYKAAREKAKHMRKAAIEAYLEAKNIKLKYNLDGVDDSEDGESMISEEENNEEKPN